ncbi:hypothetical protein J6590_088303, partial [Homalodisca vitripennis]
MPRLPEVSQTVFLSDDDSPSQPNWLDVNKLRTAILRRCETSSTPFMQVLREEIE